MTPQELEQYLHQHIPLTRAMQLAVASVGLDGVTLRAPLAPNINHRETVFGGSAAALATLSAWSLVHTRLVAAGIESRLVIQRNTMNFGHPIYGEFMARSSLPHPEAWTTFVRSLTRRGKARITIAAELLFADRSVAQFEGDFVAFAGGSDS